MCYRRISLAGSIALAIVTSILVSAPAVAQTYTVLHSFTGDADGGLPSTGLTMDKAGNLYGTTSAGGYTGDCGIGCGTVFRLVHRSSGWILNPLYSFLGGLDGAGPKSRLVFGPDGSLYGTTEFGGGASCGELGPPGCGAIFNLRPSATAPASALAPWKETVLYRFTGGTDSFYPQGDLVFDRLGNLYGTAAGYNIFGNMPSGSNGSVWELTPSGGGWSLNVLDNFYLSSGANPFGGVVFDQAGNLYGTTGIGGSDDWGTIFQLTSGGSGWIQNTLHSFISSTDGGFPEGGLVLDSSGNLYGTTFFLGPHDGGTVFQLAPSNGGWTFNVICAFPSSSCGSVSSLAMDAAGNLYGAHCGGGKFGQGNIFKLVYANDAWIYVDLYDFTGGADGAEPSGSVTLDANGNVYGTTFQGGLMRPACYAGCGVVFEIAP